MKAATLIAHPPCTYLSFQSTPPVKAATYTGGVLRYTVSISIHAAREGGDSYPRRAGQGCAISIHAAREGGDTYMGYSFFNNIGFQSTPPVKAATAALNSSLFHPTISIHAAREGGDTDCTPAVYLSFISIHAAREGGDGFGMSRLSICGHFNPRRP